MGEEKLVRKPINATTDADTMCYKMSLMPYTYASLLSDENEYDAIL